MNANGNSNGLPQNIGSERFVLGSILYNNAFFLDATAVLRVDCFLLESHQRIFRRMGELQARGVEISCRTVTLELQKYGELESCGGLAYLVSLDEGLPHASTIDSELEILLEKAAQRRIIYAAQDMMNRAMHGHDRPADIIASMQEIFATIDVTGVSGQSYRSVEDLPLLEDGTDDEISYIREPELPTSAIVALTGDSGCGKSSVATAWARDAWLRKGVRCLFLDRENPRAVVRDRRRRLSINDGPHYRWWGGWTQMEAPQPNALIIQQWVKDCDPKPIVIVDSLSAFYEGDQNDASAMRAFLQRCRKLADLGATVIVIHHDGKAETAKDYRGSSDFKAGVDQAFHVSNFSANAWLDKITLRPYKSRYGLSGPLMYSYADGRFLPSDPAEVSESVTEQLTSLLRTNPGIQTRQFEELAAKRNITRNRARIFLNDGLLSGLIRVESAGKAKRYYLNAADSRVITFPS